MFEKKPMLTINRTKIADTESIIRFSPASKILDLKSARETRIHPAITVELPPRIKINRMILLGQGINKIIKATRRGILNKPINVIFLSF